ncbi:predicted protein [Botrytis cinerea T4]|uniref:Uncharacterized protein n=1 Tax=Botryotinia fuckeliana (strain T4) TaxID=999810 RepID=G2YK51_BOTF4|nr:predicted protein [Botrytis cinerea T4]
MTSNIAVTRKPVLPRRLTLQPSSLQARGSTCQEPQHVFFLSWYTRARK